LRSVAGGIGASGTVSAVLGDIRRMVQGTLAFAGSLSRRISVKRQTDGGLGSQGALKRKVGYFRNLSGEITWSGIISTITGGLGMIIDPAIESITAVRTIVSKTVGRIMDSITPDRDIEEK